MKLLSKYLFIFLICLSDVTFSQVSNPFLMLNRSSGSQKITKRFFQDDIVDLSNLTNEITGLSIILLAIVL